jgi:hypothetical protein
LAGTPDGFLPDAPEYYYFEDRLGGNDISFEVGTEGLDGNTIIFESWYLEDDMELTAENLQLIQRVVVNFVSSITPFPRPPAE